MKLRLFSVGLAVAGLFYVSPALGFAFLAVVSFGVLALLIGGR